MAGEKTEKATPKRKQDERKKGNVFTSREMVTVSCLLAAFLALRLLLPGSLAALQEMMAGYFVLGSSQTSVTEKDAAKFFLDGCFMFGRTALPLLVICGLTAVVITLAQTKMLFSAKSFEFKGERINPLNGFKRMFSLRSVVELVKSLIKITVLLYLIYSVMKKELLTLPKLMDMQPLQAMIRTGEILMSIVLKAGLIFAFLAAADYFYQWWEYEKNLRMTKQEVKDEYKQTEGDPQVKGKIRSMQQQRARRRMMQNVPSADVVIRNPTHYAVAILYDQHKHRAPVVVAKGADALALRIVKVAEENGVYVTEDRPLARALYENVELDREIPENYYQAIAQVLAFVYSLRKKDLN